MKRNRIYLTVLLVLLGLSMQAQIITEGYVELQGQAGGGEFAPFWLISNRHGLGSTHPNNGYMRAAFSQKELKQGKFRFDYAIDLVSAVNHNANFIVQQAYTDVRYRSLFLSVGSKERTGAFKNPQLSVGNFAWSGNARPIPQVRVGFHDWVTPFRRAGWFRFKGDLSWGWFTDGTYQEETVNRQFGTTMTGMGYHHKGIYFSFGKPRGRFWMEAGYEIDIQFGGIFTKYKNGEIETRRGGSLTWGDFARSFLPMKGNSTYYEGNYVGSWQLKANYRLHQEHTLSACLETIFDDASGMSRQNMFDGLYHLEYKSKKRSFISGALIEYFQSTHQSGPLHWMPQDSNIPSDIHHSTPGADNYYNNVDGSGGWSHWGQAMGNPLITSPAYNKDGFTQFKNNRVKALHAGINGFITSEFKHCVKITYIKGWGTPFVPFIEPKSSISAFIELCYNPKRMSRFSFKLSLASDWGSLYGNNYGMNLSTKIRI